MSLAGHAFSVAAATTERSSAPAGGLSWWVLVLAIGIGTLMVLFIVRLVDRLAARSAARQPEENAAARRVPYPALSQPSQSVLVGATVAAHSVEEHVTRADEPSRHLPHLPHRPRIPRIPRPPRPHLSVPGRPHLPHLRVPRPQAAVRSVVRRRLATAPSPPPRPRPRRGARVTGEPGHVAAAAVLPAALAARTLLDPGWWRAPDGATVALLALAVVIALAGLHWLRVATERPRALRRRTRERLRSAEELRLARVDAARRLLAALDDDGGPASAWADFSREAGLHVPPRMRTLVSRQMDPEALVRYLGTQALEPTPTEQPWWVAVAVPALCCLLPAVLLIVAG